MAAALFHIIQRMRASWLQTLYRGFQRLITVVLVSWLALFAPAMCQYHGFLLGMTPPVATTRLMESEPLYTSTHARHQSDKQNAGASTTLLVDVLAQAPPLKQLGVFLVQHRSVGNDTLLMSLITLAMGDDIVLEPPARFSQQFISPTLPRRLLPPPPLPPPRLPTL